MAYSLETVLKALLALSYKVDMETLQSVIILLLEGRTSDLIELMAKEKTTGEPGSER